MVQIILIGLAAGGASALLFASVASGSLLSIPLFYLSPLPIMIAALGWSHTAGLIAACSAALALGAAFNWVFLVGFLIGVGLPAWWLGYLSLLGRPGNTPTDIEWYPVGRLVLWATLLGGTVVAIAIISHGTDSEAFKVSLRRTMERVLSGSGRAGTALDFGPGGRGEAVLELLTAILPPAAAVLAALTNVISLWLAARVVKISGRLKRPWPDIAQMRFPRSVLPVFALLLAGTFFGDTVGLLSTVLSASLLIAFGLLGLAAVHVLTRRFGARTLLLWGLYGAIGVFGWPLLLMSILGLAETTFDFRARASSGAPPANPNIT